jgi:tryptophan synthase beta subunit
VYKRQRIKGDLPELITACVGGGSNAAGMFSAFINDLQVEIVGVEAGGSRENPKKHSASLNEGEEGVFHGCRTFVLQDDNGNIKEAHSVAPGLDYPAVGPEHAYWKHTGRVSYVKVFDDEALEAFEKLSKLEGIIPALESAHALAYLWKLEKKPENAVVCVSGRGDKDLEEYFRLRKDGHSS